MKIRIISVILLMSVVLTACSDSVEFEQEQETIAETTTVTSTSTTTSGTSGTMSPTTTTEVVTEITTTQAATQATTVITTPVTIPKATKKPKQPKPPSPPVHKPVVADEVIGVWISYLELATVLTGKTESQFRQNYAAMLDNCRTLGINTVYVHLRPFGDALYESDYFPWSRIVTGEVGKKPAFDPLKVMLEETHKRNISFHGWLNPMRLMNDTDMKKVSQTHAIGKWYNDSSKRGTYIVKHGDRWFFNPAYKEVTDLIGNGAMEIAAKYNVDGIHIDDYFYPTTDNSFDNAAFNASPQTSRKQFRFNNVNNMVNTMYSSTKKGNPNALFGISPQASIENNYNKLYADVETWCKKKGYADYIIPQFYYGFNNPAQPYVECVNRWQEMLKGSHVKLMFGLAVYKIGVEDEWAGSASREWITDKQILKRQIQEARKTASYNGVVFFSYNNLFNPSSSVKKAVNDEIAAFKPIL